MNLTAQKTFKLTERATLRFIGAAMDAFNHPIFNNPGHRHYQRRVRTQHQRQRQP